MSSKPGSGTGTPHAMSRVIGRRSNPPPIMPSTKFLTESRQWSWPETQALSRSVNFGRSR
nr:hypothetical protein [Rubrobacter marinus]